MPRRRPGSALRIARVRAGYGVRELATLAGINRSTLWRLETGKRQPEDETQKKLSKALGMPAPELFMRVAAADAS
jgi:transcriptional regulator with XRE-family HTH domain